MTAQPGTKAAKGPPGMLQIEPLFESLASWHGTALAPLPTSSRTDYGHMTVGEGAQGGPMTSPSAAPQCCAQALSDSIPAARHQVPSTEKTIYSQRDHELQVFFSPFLPWNDVTAPCGETHFCDIWDISTQMLGIRNTILKKKEKPN